MASRSLFASSSRAAASYLRNSAPRRGFREPLIAQGLSYSQNEVVAWCHQKAKELHDRQEWDDLVVKWNNRNHMFQVKEGLKYTRTHEWVNVDETSATFGVTDYAFAHFRFLDYFWIPEVGTSVTQGKTIKRADTYFYMKSGLRYKNIFAPVSGKIVQANNDVKESHRLGKLYSPNLLGKTSSDGKDYKFFYPYEDGWMVKIEMSDPSEVDKLMDSDQYSKFIEDKDAAKATLYNL